MEGRMSVGMQRQATPFFRADWPGAEKARPLSVSEQIARQVGEMIVLGDYAPGARLIEEQISTDFGVSRNPVREALRILERDGFVSISARRGAQVVSLSPTEAMELFEIEGELYGLMARRLARRAPEEALGLMENAIEMMDQSIRADAPCVDFLVLVNRLSLDLAHLCGNDSLPQVMSRILVRNVGFTRSSLTCPNRKERILATWRTMLTDVRAGDAEGAERAARAIVGDFASAVLKLAAEAEAEAAATASS